MEDEFGESVEILDDGSAVIDNFDDEIPGLREHDENLLDTLDDDQKVQLASEIRGNYSLDFDARAEWMKIYKDGLGAIVGKDVEENSSRANRNMTEVVHPLIAEAATQFQARAISELFPASGPVGTTVIGQTTTEIQDQARRVSDHMNYQLTEEMEEYFPDLDQMLFHLPLVGQAYKKSWFDVNLGRVTSRFVQAEDFVVDANAVSLASAERYYHLLRIPRHEYDDYVANGFYEDTISGSQTVDANLPQDIEGVSPVAIDDGLLELIEAHVYATLDDEGQSPYIVTMNAITDELVAVRRNWDPEDETRRKEVWFTSYKFLPGLGFYGFGLYHVIGGLGKAATGALRSLLDAATFSNMQGGFKLRGRVRGGEIDIRPGEFADIDAAVDDINKAIMPLPFKEPSQTMMALLQFVVETGKKFANTANMNISDANQNTPVGTTVALLEEGTRVFSAIHKRLHNSQRQEFKLIAKLNGIYLPARYPFSVKGEDRYVLKSDFNSRIDVIPVSDPNTFSSTQRIAQAQAGLQLAEKFPQLHNMHLAVKRMYEALRYPNYEEILLDPADIPRMDAMAENVALMHGNPIKTFEDQDHTAHMTVLDEWFNRLDKQAQQMYIKQYAGHRAEHMALYYRSQIQAQLEAPLPALPDYSDQNKAGQSVDAKTDEQISQAVAVVVNRQKQPPMGPPLPQMGGGAQGAAQDPMAAAKMLAQAEAISIKAKSDAEIQSKQAKAQADLQMQREKMQNEMQMKQAMAKMDMQLKMIELQAKGKEAAMREASKSETDRAKLEMDIRAMWMKAQAEIEIARQKADADMQCKYHSEDRMDRRDQYDMLNPSEVTDVSP
jgi:hypothetical protein